MSQIMEFNGCSIFVNCGSFGVFQGKVSYVDPQSKTLTLINVMKNGEFIPGSQILNSAEIIDIKVLKMGTPRERGEIPPRQSKTVAINGKNAKKVSNDAKPEQISLSSPSIFQKESQQNETPKEKLVPIQVKTPESDNPILNKLFHAPLQSPSLFKDNQKGEETQTVIDKQNKNKQSMFNPMIPTSAFKILKRGEPLPQGITSNDKANQKELFEKMNQESVELIAPVEVAISANELKKQKNKARKGKKSESEKNQTSNTCVSQILNFQPIFSLESTQASKTFDTKHFVNDETQTLNSIEIEKSKSTTSASSPIPGGLRIDPISLISALAAPSSISSSSAKNSPRKLLTERSLSVNDQPLNKPQQFEKFGDFKRFTEKQAPVPCNFNSNNHRSRGNTCSPSGVPQKDFSNGYGKVHRKNRDLDGPIDHDAFKNDFDFGANLALFVREEDEEGEDTDAFEEPPAHIRNYRNDENILGDPSRVTSWTSNIHEFQHSTLFDGKEGMKIPILTVEEKKRFINVVTKSLGNDVFNTSIADHLFSLILNVISKNSLKIENIVLLGSVDTNVSLINRLAINLSNRKFHSYFVDCSCRFPLPSIEFVDEYQIRQIVKNIQIVVNLEQSISPKLEMVWLNRIGCGDNSAHIIGLEQEFTQYPNSHSLYLGTLVESPPKHGRYSLQQSVADLSIPFSWFKEEACNALCKAFSKSTLISI